MKLRWRKICEWRWESELTLAGGGYAVDRAPGVERDGVELDGSRSFTILKLKPRASTKEQMRWEVLGGAWSVPDAKRMALHDADGTTKRFAEKARAERAAAREAKATRPVVAEDGRVLTKVELPPVRCSGWGEFWETIESARKPQGGGG